MIDSPRTEVLVQPAETFQLVSEAELSETILQIVADWRKHFAPDALRAKSDTALPVRIEVQSAARHSGLGSGTQLALSIATALQIAFDQPLPSSEELAMALGRGKRSAIGSYGFHQGGFLVDRGIGDEPIAPLDMRIDFPEPWKIVLIEPASKKGKTIFGEAERDAFRNLPSTTQAQSDQLKSLLQQSIVPAILSQDFSSFANAVTEFGFRSGMFYAPVQGGAYATPAAQQIVDLVSSLGEFAVGQSSWGPTVFAIGPSADAAKWLVEKIREHGEDVDCQTRIVSADNDGMVVRQSH
ncbi:hypothetical protein MFFC18_33300 [Mariniblastus fucicola]|uniref:Uncharacterized protein n=3 Tax=Mariniblastus fucicola TaxID=980251 RepID=A0A5B9PL75_9BACT|nr:hypothetical protein MFFC18_33300 [Mariniblastus fucicola]